MCIVGVELFRSPRSCVVLKEAFKFTKAVGFQTKATSGEINVWGPLDEDTNGDSDLRGKLMERLISDLRRFVGDTSTRM